jgi:transcription-repair coupling factor (superfamily II helicase)
MRINWGDGKTHVEANFNAKRGSKSQITVQHSKLSNSEMVESMKAYWKKHYNVLRIC